MKIKILVIDDEKLIRGAIVKRLNKMFENQFEIFEAKNGKVALDLFSRIPFGIVLTDLKMPEIDGIELLEVLHEKYKNKNCLGEPISTVVISGYAEFDYAEKAIRYGVSGYLLKPIRKSEFADLIQKLIKRNKENIIHAYKEDGLSKQHQLLNQYFCFGNETINLYSNNYIHENENYRLMLIHIDGSNYNNSEYTFEDKELIQFSVNNILNEILPENHALKFLSMENESQIMVLFHHKNMNELEEMSQKMSIVFWHQVNRILNITASIGMSAMKEQLTRTLYSECQEALALRLTLGKGKIYSYDPNREIEYYKAFRGRLEMLESYMKKQEILNVKMLIQIIFDEISDVNREPINIRHLMNDVLLIIQKSFMQLNHWHGMVEAKKMLDQNYSNEESIETIRDSLLIFIDQSHQEVKKYSVQEIYEDAKEYIKTNYRQDISLKEIALKYMISENYLYNILKGYSGMSYKQYVKKLRIEEAMKLLQTTELKVSHIGAMCGYCDPLYFSKVFKKEMGMNPTEYRKQLTKK